MSSSHDDLRHRLAEAAIEAELETGQREPTRRLAVRHVVLRLARIGFAFVLLLIGLAMLVLPGPGLVLIAASLVLLSRDFVWAERLLAKVTSRLPEGIRPGRLSGGQMAGAAAVGIASSAAIWYVFA